MHCTLSSKSIWALMNRASFLFLLSYFDADKILDAWAKSCKLLRYAKCISIFWLWINILKKYIKYQILSLSSNTTIFGLIKIHQCNLTLIDVALHSISYLVFVLWMVIIRINYVKDKRQVKRNNFKVYIYRIEINRLTNLFLSFCFASDDVL